MKSVTPSEESSIRDEFPGCLVPVNIQRNSYSLHIMTPDGGRLCARMKDYPGRGDRERPEFREKDWVIYPEGNYDICDYCTHVWRCVYR